MEQKRVKYNNPVTKYFFKNFKLNLYNDQMMFIFMIATRSLFHYSCTLLFELNKDFRLYQLQAVKIPGSLFLAVNDLLRQAHTTQVQ